MEISEIDKNFKLNSVVEPDIVWKNAKDLPFKTYGVFYDEERKQYLRMPQSVADTVSPGVAYLNLCTAGGRIRFTTSSPYIAVKCVVPHGTLMPHITMVAQFGFSICYDGEYAGRINPEFKTLLPENAIDGKIAFCGQVKLSKEKPLHDVTIYMPLYNGVSELFIGVKEDSVLISPPDYTYERPILFYGSSITQGGCASRPGNDYAGLIGQALDSDIYNLGFSGNAKGEKQIVDYLCAQNPSVFVLDYDHNAPTVAHLEQTHLPLYKAFREAHPTTPIVMTSAPDYWRDCGGERRAVVSRTYDYAISNGDKNIYFIGGEELFGNDYQFCTVDGCHPNDLGFYKMAQAYCSVLRPLIETK